MTIRDRLTTLCAIVILLAAGLAASSRAEGLIALTTDPAAPISRSASASPLPESDVRTFSTTLAKLSERSLGESALNTVVVLADDIGSRPAGSENERRAANYLAGEYRALGYDVRITPFSMSAGRGESQNVEARAANEDPDARLIIIGAHYDSVPQGPGANDNGSGTATILEVARELAASPVSGVVVRYVSFGAEEVGLLGSKAYVEAMPQRDRQRVALMMSVDMMAVGDHPAFGGTPDWVFQAMARAESQGYQPINQSDRLRRMSDHAPFIEAGMPALMFHWVDDPFYHTVMDISANLKPAAMELMGAIAIEMVRVAAR
jgi:hypothetical protein